MSTAEATKKRKKAALSSFSIIVLLIIALAIITIIMKASGAAGITAATLGDVTTSPIAGFKDAIGVCLFVLVIGGYLGTVTETGALETGIATLVRKMQGRELILIPILMILFSLGGTTYGMCEETVPFYALLAATFFAAGFDTLVGSAVVLLGAGCGCLGSTINPFAAGVATDALSSAGIEVNQSIVLVMGAATWIITTAIAIIFVMRYAKKVKADKGSTFLSLQEQDDMMVTYGGIEEEEKNGDVLSGTQKAILWIFGLSFVVMIIGFIPWDMLGINGFLAGGTFDADGNFLTLPWSAYLTGTPLGWWYFDEASTWFLLMAIVIAFVGKMGEGHFVDTWLRGAGEMMPVVMIIAFARGVTVLMAKTGLSDFILTNAAEGLSGMSAGLFAPLAFLLLFALSFLIPSSSGLATISIPILGPLAQNLGFNPDVMVSIFASANGTMNLFTPTNGAIMGGLAIAHITWSTWVKFSWKVIALIGLASMVIVTIGMIVLS